MKKIIFAFIIIIFTWCSRQAFAQAFEEGNVVISAGYGWPNLVGAVFKTYETQGGYKASSVGPVYFKGEYAVADKIGIGLNFAWGNSKVTYISEGVDSNFNSVDYTAKINRSTYSVLGRVNFHFGESDKFDPFVGIGVGYRNATWKFTDENPNSINQTVPNLIPFGFEVTVGARYYFTDIVGIYAELGLAKSPIQAGLVIKI